MAGLGVPSMGRTDLAALNVDRELLAGLLDLVGPVGPHESVKKHGAKGDGVTDDTAAFQSAIDAAHVNGAPVWIDPVLHPLRYLVSGSGSAIFPLTRPISILGAGPYSQILVASGVPTTRDVFSYDSENAGIAGAFPLFRGFRITGETAGVGRYGINFKPGAAKGVFRFGVERVWVMNLSSFGVYLDGSASAVSTGWIRDCNINGPGIGGTTVYDSILIDNCVLFGTGYAIDIASFMSGGPGKFIVTHCNITASGGCRFAGGTSGMYSLSLTDNYFEPLSTFSGADGAYVNLNGASGSVLYAPIVLGNLFATISGVGDPDGLRVNYAEKATIDHNLFRMTPAGTVGAVITANATDAFFGPGNTLLGSGTLYTNAGTNSQTCTKVALP